MNKTNIIHYTKIIIKCFVEFLPVLSFFLVYEYTHENFYTATLSMMIMTVLYTVYTFHKQKRIPYLALFLCFETGLFGALTLIFKDPAYVQMRDSFYDFMLGSAILISGYFNRSVLKSFFGHIFKLSDEVWRVLSFKWGTLLLVFGFTNEIVRRNYDEWVWVNYKFTAMFITIVFGLYLLWKYRRSVSVDTII